MNDWPPVELEEGETLEHAQWRQDVTIAYVLFRRMVRYEAKIQQRHALTDRSVRRLLRLLIREPPGAAPGGTGRGRVVNDS